jgi:aminoglycoside phosphotransferase (APT) family kinase protein
MKNLKQDFFTMDDDFPKIVGDAIPGADFAGATRIASGWTNIVFNVPAGGAEYIFRFPRNDFWARAIEKDVAFSEFIAPRVSAKVPDAKLSRDEGGRPFSIHEKIPGECLTDAMGSFSDSQIRNVVRGIAEYLRELGDAEIGGLPEICNQKESDFLNGLSKVYEKYSGFDNALDGMPEDTVVHGDLNPGNILVDRDGNVLGIIDHAFAGISHAIFDLSNIASRCPESWKNKLVAAYKDATGKGVDEALLNDFMNCRRSVEAGYIAYMKAEMPEITLPPGF